jgi:hypothetical protein
MMKLHFDNYISEPIPIDNGIGQGDLISIIADLFYNADLLEITESRGKSMLAFIDDVLTAVEGNDFNETRSDLQDIMNHEGGGFDWGMEHNLRFEIDKLAVMHCMNKHLQDPSNLRKSILLPRPALELYGRTIKEVDSYKYLGFMVDNKLRWGV